MLPFCKTKGQIISEGSSSCKNQFRQTGFLASKNQVRNRLKIQSVELDFSKLIFQKSSTDQQGVKSESNELINFIEKSGHCQTFFSISPSRIDRFNDKKQTLALMDLGKHTVLNNSFRDSKMPGGPQV